MRILKVAAKWLFGVLFVAAGVNHFLNPDVYVRIVPPYLPWPRELVLVSGVAEVLLGVLFLIPATTRLAAWGLIALLVAVFPANLHMALHPDAFPEFAAWFLWLRLPLQAALIAWAWAYARRS